MPDVSTQPSMNRPGATSAVWSVTVSWAPLVGPSMVS